MIIWPEPSGLPHTKEGSILIAEGPIAFSPASSPALILALTCISCSWLSLKGESVSSTCKTGETLSGMRSQVTNVVQSHTASWPVVFVRPSVGRPPWPERLLCCCRCLRGRTSLDIPGSAGAKPSGGVWNIWSGERVVLDFFWPIAAAKKKSLTLRSIHTTTTTSYWGCVLYTVPSTPTVIFSSSSFRLVLIRVKIADRPAATRLDDLKDTMVLTCWTATQSSYDGLKPSQVRISLVLSRPVLYLKMKRWGFYERMWTWMCGMCELCKQDCT